LRRCLGKYRDGKGESREKTGKVIKRLSKSGNKGREEMSFYAEIARRSAVTRERGTRVERLSQKSSEKNQLSAGRRAVMTLNPRGEEIGSSISWGGKKKRANRSL